jgi:outer membrane murein-binding lipoprotein Lpp
MVRQLAFIILFFALVLFGCVTTARFDQHVYIQTTSAKVDALNVMDLATEDYSSHQLEVKQVITNIEKTYEYERNRKNNEITIKLWNKLKDTSGHLFGGFVKRWKNEMKLRPVFIQESKKQVSEAFDIIAQLESKKIKPKQVKD